ncbi:MAG TPA: lipocalin family protein [Puia sp.]|nr:lipocalin family protein [Puia sp.]
MKYNLSPLLLAICAFAACQSQPDAPLPSKGLRLNGTWRLVSGTTITKGVSTVTDYTRDSKFIKIINDDHFAFLKHDLNPAKDSSNHFDAGGGSYTLNGDQYTEHLDFYGDHNWEGKPFTFTVSISHDTLTQRGLEKVEKENIDREIIERYVREGK